MERGAVPQMRLALLITGFQFTEERVLTPRAEDLYTGMRTRGHRSYLSSIADGCPPC